MKLEHVASTRHRAPLFSTPAKVQEQRVLRSCVVIALCAILLLLSFPSLRAQDIYTQRQLPKIGLHYVKQWVTPGLVDPQPGGLNQKWNFLTLKAQKAKLDTIDIVDATTVIGDVPPFANVAVVNRTNNQRTYYNTLTPSLQYWGEQNNDQKMLLGSSPLDIEPIPIKFNQMINRVYTATLQFVKDPARSIRRVDSVNFTPDGNGTLSIPGLAVTQVVRVRWTETIIDTVLQNNIPLYQARTTRTRYVWYGDADCIEYLTISRADVRFSAITGLAPKDSLLNEAQYYVGGSATSVMPTPEVDAEFNVTPNPSQEFIDFHGRAQHEQAIRVQVYNVVGEHIATVIRSCDAGPFSLRLNCADFVSGAYILRAEVDGFLISRVVHIHR